MTGPVPGYARRAPQRHRRRRGPVRGDCGAHAHCQANDISGVIIDCWENEPELNLDLLNHSDFGTPHIAGYSKDGKANGTKMSVQAISRFFNLGIDDWKPSGVELPGNATIELDGNQRREYSILAEAILSTYDIENDEILEIEINPNNLINLPYHYVIISLLTEDSKMIKIGLLFVINLEKNYVLLFSDLNFKEQSKVRKILLGSLRLSTKGNHQGYLYL